VCHHKLRSAARTAPPLVETGRHTLQFVSHTGTGAGRQPVPPSPHPSLTAPSPAARPAGLGPAPVPPAYHLGPAARPGHLQGPAVDRGGSERAPARQRRQSRGQLAGQGRPTASSAAAGLPGGFKGLTTTTVTNRKADCEAWQLTAANRMQDRAVDSRKPHARQGKAF
jgi:hypothetical protein